MIYGFWPSVWTVPDGKTMGPPESVVSERMVGFATRHEVGWRRTVEIGEEGG